MHIWKTDQITSRRFIKTVGSSVDWSVGQPGHTLEVEVVGEFANGGRGGLWVVLALNDGSGVILDSLLPLSRLREVRIVLQRWPRDFLWTRLQLGLPSICSSGVGGELRVTPVKKWDDSSIWANESYEMTWNDLPRLHDLGVNISFASGGTTLYGIQGSFECNEWKINGKCCSRRCWEQHKIRGLGGAPSSPLSRRPQSSV